jgi:hypothetical protein
MLLTTLPEFLVSPSFFTPFKNYDEYNNDTGTAPVPDARKPGVFCIDRCSLSPEFRIFYTSFLVPMLCAIRAVLEKRNS